MGNYATGLNSLNQALRLEPTHRLALYNSATLMADTRLPELRREARTRLLRLMETIQAEEHALGIQGVHGQQGQQGVHSQQGQQGVHSQHAHGGQAQVSRKQASTVLLGSAHANVGPLAAASPQLADIYFQLAMLAGDDNLHLEAESYYLLVIQVFITHVFLSFLLAPFSLPFLHV